MQARLTYSTGFRAPQAYDEDLHVTAVGGEGVQIRLADGLREERSNSFQRFGGLVVPDGALAVKHSSRRVLYGFTSCICARRYR